MDEYEVDKPPAFTTKKLIVIGFCLGNIIMMIVYAAMSYTIAWRFLYEYESFAPHQVDDAKTIVIVTLVSLSIVSSAFSLFGIVSTIRADFKLSCIFAGLLLINTIMTLVNAIKRPYYWAAPTWSIITLLVLVIMMRDFHTVERNQKNQFRDHKTRTKELYFN
ncbi:hypothetical protein RDWZM_002991 [Blomia tropicalis]|uniref:Uncharacterized protein n=1 Tax=Blomia tropicalis TaxID=40697 RepID=A0A9Q0MEE6_BLOTA|nr:hypothetical protein BLOT_001015 [Blomia tropicalis]KAJ6224446.1 hypothetical protein RDWZM_002991 [Blomia tropicalis]